jgi:hypothetical protein
VGAVPAAATLRWQGDRGRCTGDSSRDGATGERLDAAGDRPWRPGPEHRLLAATTVGFDDGRCMAPTIFDLGKRAHGVGHGRVTMVAQVVEREKDAEWGMFPMAILAMAAIAPVTRSSRSRARKSKEEREVSGRGRARLSTSRREGPSTRPGSGAQCGHERHALVHASPLEQKHEQLASIRGVRLEFQFGPDLGRSV